jgi:hypothetical protein
MVARDGTSKHSLALAAALVLGACTPQAAPAPETMSGAGSGGISSGSAAGGNAGVGGSSATGGSSGAASGGAGGASSAAAGASGSGGASGGSVFGGGAAGMGGSMPLGPIVDPRGTELCDETPLQLGEVRLLTNEWTDPEADTCIFLDQLGQFGWHWTRGATGSGDNPTYPNYPEAEFGINPWNTDSIDTSTTDLLPLQLKDFTSASMTLEVFTDVGANNSGWNLAFELWLSDADPTLGPTSPKGEIMVFLSNEPNYYPSSPETPQVLNDGEHEYDLYVSSDNWGTWGYYRQYRLGTHDGKFNGKLNIYAFLQHYLQSEGWDGNLWVTRFEIGNEVFQNSGGTTTFKNLSFEVNGQTRQALTE